MENKLTFGDTNGAVTSLWKMITLVGNEPVKRNSLLSQCIITFLMLVLIDHLDISGKQLPLKIKFWLWLIWHNAIATTDNMIKRKWAGDPLCRFCRDNKPEIIFSLVALLPNMSAVL